MIKRTMRDSGLPRLGRGCGMVLMLLGLGALPIRAELVLHAVEPEVWQNALDAYAQGQYEDALIQFAALDREERDHAEEPGSVLPLTRLFLLKCLAGLGRDEDLAKRIHLLEPDRLSKAFGHEARILQLQVDRDQGQMDRVVEQAVALLAENLSPTRQALVAWLCADALIELDRGDEAVEMLTRCIVSSDLETAKESALALGRLADLLETRDAVGEAESLRLLRSVLGGDASGE